MRPLLAFSLSLAPFGAAATLTANRQSPQANAINDRISPIPRHESASMRTVMLDAKQGNSPLSFRPSIKALINMTDKHLRLSFEDDLEGKKSKGGRIRSNRHPPLLPPLRLLRSLLPQP